jgi:hypothetical protein
VSVLSGFFDIVTNDEKAETRPVYTMGHRDLDIGMKMGGRSENTFCNIMKTRSILFRFTHHSIHMCKVMLLSKE